MSIYISGRNPVREALLSEQQTINKIFLSQSSHGSVISDIIKLAKERNIPIHHVPPQKIDSLSKDNNQGVVAETSPTKYLELNELWEMIKGLPCPLIVILDSIEDPHNMGAIIRSAVALGADGIIIGKWHTAGLTETITKTSAGASQHIPIARVTNIAETINRLKEMGIWVAGADVNAKPIDEEQFSFPLALVIGSEGKGLHRLIKERCDTLIAIPQTNKISSLNASCAASIILYEVYRQKNSKTL